jgi:hypothetical protein
MDLYKIEIVDSKSNEKFGDYNIKTINWNNSFNFIDNIIVDFSGMSMIMYYDLDKDMFFNSTGNLCGKIINNIDSDKIIVELLMKFDILYAQNFLIKGELDLNEVIERYNLKFDKLTQNVKIIK